MRAVWRVIEARPATFIVLFLWALFGVYAGVTCEGSNAWEECRFNWHCAEPNGAAATCEKTFKGKRCMVECRKLGRRADAPDCPDGYVCTTLYAHYKDETSEFEGSRKVRYCMPEQR